MSASPASRRPGWRSLLLGLPGLLWLVVFLTVPLALIVGVSFLERGEFGELTRELTTENYRRVAGFGALGFEPLFPQIVARSVMLAAASTLLCIAAGLPLAFFIAGLPARWKTTALTLVVIPLWTNLLIRTYAWQILLGPGSWAAQLAAAAGWIAPAEGIYPGHFAVLAGMVCDYLPFFVLPLYASVEKLDWSLAEAAGDLGAGRWNTFRHAIWPQIRPGLIAGAILVLVPATGQFVIPDLLGGSKTALIGNVLEQQFNASRDWPFGSALAVPVILLVLAGLWWQARIAARSGGEDAA